MNQAACKVEWIAVQKIFYFKYYIHSIIPDDISAMMTSVQKYGIIYPLLLRKTSAFRYEVIDGAQRLCAAVLCGIKEVPAIVLSCTEEECLGFFINMRYHNRTTHYLEYAYLFEKLLKDGWSMERIAAMSAIDKDSIKNKLNLLQHDIKSRSLFIQYQIDECIALSLLSLPEASRERTLSYIISNHMDVYGASKYISNLYQGKTTPRPSGICQMVRAALRKANALAEKNQVSVQMREQAQGGETTFLFRIKNDM